MANKKIYSRGYRVRKAYWTAFVVMMSYVRLSFLSKILGNHFYQKRIGALHLKNANRVKKAILKLEGLFIKVGQLLSILSNFLPEAFQEPLEALQNQIPPRPFDEIEQRIEKELGQKPEVLFSFFDKNPLASASIGQAHRATLKDGTEVVVKVQHANIEKIAEIDLEIMERLTNLMSYFYKVKGIEFAYTQVQKMIREELNFKQEALAMQRVQKNLSGELDLIIPSVHESFSTKRVLTTTFCEGVKINDIETINQWNINKKDLGNRLVHIYCQMVFGDGFYHADPHPGNILVQKNGTIVLLDFGATGTLQQEMRDGFLKLIEAASQNDSEKIIDALQSLGFIAYERNAEKVAEKVILAFRTFLQNEVEFDGLNFKDLKVNPFQSSLFNLTTEIGLKGIANTVQVPKEYVLLNRMVTLLLGICNTLDSSINPIDVVKPYFQTFILGESGDMVKFATDFIKKSATTLLTIPGDLGEVLNKARRGKLEIQHPGEVERTKLFYALGQQFVYSILMIASFGFGYLLFQNGQNYYGKWINGMGIFFGLLLFQAIRRGREIKKLL
jgi:predicted unusual protein kinase regulating ubiquinone biosynthesis (AarF/ABC1/UbiB family)